MVGRLTGVQEVLDRVQPTAKRYSRVQKCKQLETAAAEESASCIVTTSESAALEQNAKLSITSPPRLPGNFLLCCQFLLTLLKIISASDIELISSLWLTFFHAGMFSS